MLVGRRSQARWSHPTVIPECANMAISVVCACGKKLQVKDEMAGKRGKCPACGKVLDIPAAPNAAKGTVDFDPLGASGGGLDLGSIDPLAGSSDPFATTGSAADPLGGTMTGTAPAGGNFAAGNAAGGFTGGQMAGGYGKPAA